MRFGCGLRANNAEQQRVRCYRRAISTLRPFFIPILFGGFTSMLSIVCWIFPFPSSPYVGWSGRSIAIAIASDIGRFGTCACMVFRLPFHFEQSCVRGIGIFRFTWQVLIDRSSHRVVGGERFVIYVPVVDTLANCFLHLFFVRKDSYHG